MINGNQRRFSSIYRPIFRFCYNIFTITLNNTCGTGSVNWQVTENNYSKADKYGIQFLFVFITFEILQNHANYSAYATYFVYTKTKRHY